MRAGVEHALGTVTLAVPTRDVETRTVKDGREFHIARLPDGTRLRGRDLSGALVCSGSAYESRDVRGITEMELPAGVAKVVKVPADDVGHVRYETFETDPAELCDAVRDALDRMRELAMARQVVACLEAGNRTAARQACEVLLGADGTCGHLPPDERPDSTPGATRADVAREYEAMGILPAHLSVCSANIHAPDAKVPERFSYVAIDEGHCVTAGFFNWLLEQARSRVPCHGGVLEEHSIGYVAHQLRHPFAHVHGRLVAEVNGIGVDFTEEVRVVPGSTCGHGDRREDARDVDGMGVASLSVDKAGLINLLSMSGEEADALSDWMRNRVESDLAIACDRIGVAHVSSLLRSPDVVRLLVEWGTPLENPATGERMARSPETGEIECDFSTDLSLVDSQEEDEAALMDWYCLRVASDDRWRVDGDVALHIAYDKEGPWAELRETARAAYLADPWLTTRARVEAIPTVERTQDLLAREDPAEVRRGYRVREECESRDVRPPGKGSPVPPRERVA